MALHTGRSGRIIGVIWGTLWFAIGVAAVLVILDVLEALPQGVERFLTQFAPWLLTIAPPDASPVWVGGMFGIFAVIGLVYGSYHIIRALTQPDYSATFMLPEA